MSQMLYETSKNLDNSVLSLDDSVLSLDDSVLSLDDSVLSLDDESISNDWFDTAWKKRIPIKINASQVPSTQNNFPLLINSIFPDLIGKSINEIKFAGIDKAQLDYDIKKFDSITGKLIAWAKKPIISNGDYTFLYFDNPDAIDSQNPNVVWSDYVARWSLSDDPVGVDSIIDSTINPRHGTPTNGVLSVDGQIEKAIDLDGVDDYVELGNIPFGDKLMLAGSDISISCIIKPRFGGDVFQRIVEKSNFGAADNGYGLVLNDQEIIFYIGGARTISAAGMVTDPNKFYHITATKHTFLDSQIFLDGVLLNTNAVSRAIPDAETNMRIGTWNHNENRFYGGSVEELRISSIIPTADRVTTEFNNYDNPELFYSIGVTQTF